MKAKFVRMLLIVWPCSCLWLAASPPTFAGEAKPKARTPDIQGTWNLVSREKNGKGQPQTKARIYITATMIYTDGVLLPDGQGHRVWPYELDPGDKPNAATIDLSGAQGRDLVPGICALDGTTLRIVLGRITPTRARPRKEVKADRPKEFATRPGTDHVLYVLKRVAAADDPILLLRKLDCSETMYLWG